MAPGVKRAGINGKYEQADHHRWEAHSGVQQRDEQPPPGKATQAQGGAQWDADQGAEQQGRARHAQRQRYNLEQGRVSGKDQMNGLSQATQDLVDAPPRRLGLRIK
jgi:hypothetical protein